MAVLNIDKEITALLVIDPYNDFISEGGKLWNRIKTVAEANRCVPNMLKVLNAARNAGIRVLYALHHRYRPGDYETWKYIAPIQRAASRSRVFEDGTWGGEVRNEFKPQAGDIVASEHWCSSSFANTDLDLPLKRHGIHKLIVIGEDRVVQFTPPGSFASIHIGKGITTAAPGSAGNLMLAVANVDEAREELKRLGVAVSEVFHPGNGSYHRPATRVAGPDPERQSYRSFASFSDPDGNPWLLQEITTRLPGRGLSMDVATLTELLRETAEHHGEYEKPTPSTIGGTGMRRRLSPEWSPT